jgi:hypothetical protein
MKGDGTRKLYQRVQVVHQGESGSDSDKCEKRTFTPEVVARFTFQVVAGNVPE